MGYKRRTEEPDVRISDEDRDNPFLGLDLGQTSMEIDARRRVADITAVARMKEDLYAIAGYIQHVEGIEIPFAVVWDYEARRARLFMGDEEWEKVLQQ